MGKLLDWVKQSVTSLIDPEREVRITTHARALHRELVTKRTEFDLELVLEELDVSPSDAGLVVERVYWNILTNVWKDLQISENEKKGMNFAARALDISPERQNELNWHMGQQKFGRFLAKAMEDDRIDDSEAHLLAQIAKRMNTTVPHLMKNFFRQEGEHFLRGLFQTAVHDGHLTSGEWQNLQQTTHRLGMEWGDFLQTIEPQAREFVEHVLIDAKADGVLGQQEDETLQWLLQRFQLSDDFRRYVDAEIAELRLFTNIAKGKLPSITDYLDVELRSGELVHYHGPVRYHIVRRLKSGPRWDTHVGTATTTDDRLIFSSPTSAITLKHAKVVALYWTVNGIEVRSNTRGGGFYDFGDRNRLAYAIYRTAVGRANRTIVEEIDDLPARHIPQEIRNRVYQRYGGRCAQCGATDYLEFDHILPVTKGGSSSEQNVQLLCRRCNLKKSDHI